MAPPWRWSPSRPDGHAAHRAVPAGPGGALAGLVFLVSGGPWPVVIWLLGLGLALTLGVAYERVRYKSLAAQRPGAGLGEDRGALRRSRDRQAGHRLFPCRGRRTDVCGGVGGRGRETMPYARHDLLALAAHLGLGGALPGRGRRVRGGAESLPRARLHPGARRTHYYRRSDGQGRRAEIAGTYLRNGPNPATPISYTYPLDGDGMIHALVFEEGRARYANRFVIANGGAEGRSARRAYDLRRADEFGSSRIRNTCRGRRSEPLQERRQHQRHQPRRRILASSG